LLLKACDTSIVLRNIHGTTGTPTAYRNSNAYDTLTTSRQAVRPNYFPGDRKAVQMKRILIIEDDRDIVELVRYNLANEGFQVSSAHDGSTGLSTLKKTPPDLLLLDLMLPKLSGLDICREVRKDDSMNRLPILMLTARGEEADRVVGLEMGADDYVTKPFSPRELIARVKALLRRAEPPVDSPRTIEVGRLAIDPASYRVSHSGKPVPLSTLEFRLLYYLASRPNRVFTRDQLLDAVWGTDRFVTPRSVDVYVRRLREKIESDPENPIHLKTVRGAGYLFETRAA
jgi:two-component system, OmpR family, alkaline phosphatase synthesis response regulator PhoP